MTKIHKKKKTKVQSTLIKNHRLAFRNARSQILQSPLSSLTTCLILAFTLILATSMLISLHTVKHIANSLHANNQVTFYLKNKGHENDIKALLGQLQQNDLILESSYISPEQALQELSSQTEFKDVLVDVQNNPLPPVLLISFKSQEREQINALVNSISQQPFVEAVHLNSELFDRIFAIIQLGNRVTYVMALLLSVGMLFIISHSIQEATTKNHQEMLLAELMGATTSYIRRPFLYVGSLLGFTGGVICILLISLLFLSLRNPLQHLLQSYSLPLPQLLNGHTSLQVIAFSTFLGWLGAWISFYKYAKLPHN